MDIAKIPIGRKPPHDINVIVEIPQGGEAVKYVKWTPSVGPLGPVS